MMYRMRVIALALGTVLLPLAAAAEPVTLKFAFFTGETEKTWISALKPFVDAVNAEGGDAVKVQPFTNGALGRNLAQQAQMVLDGVADIAFLVPGLTPGRFPENAVLELPGLYRNTREATMTFTGLIADNKLKGYEDFFVVGAFGSAPESIHMRTPVTTYKDFAGKKIRGTNPTSANIVRALGGASVLLPTNEVAEAIARGTLDGTLLQPIPLVDFGIARVINYHYFAQLGSTPLVALMNRKKFESLSPQGQAVIRKFSGQWIAERYAEGITRFNDDVVKQFRADPKQTVIVPAEAEMAELQAIYKRLNDVWVAENPRNAELLAALQAKLKTVQ